MAERKALSKKIRFEVFKRDKFTCQYCGISAPSVLLEVDHIKPVIEGGENDITNLVTSCFDCNRGKGKRELSDDAVIMKRKSQIDELQERREQIEMMLEWQTGLTDLSGAELNAAITFINSLIDPFSLSDIGIQHVKKYLPRYGLSEVMECARISSDQYLEIGKDGKYIKESVNKVLDYIERIAKSRRVMQKKPYLADLYKLKNLMKYKGFYLNERRALDLLEEAYLSGHEIQELELIIRRAGNWSDWRDAMQEILNGES